MWQALLDAIRRRQRRSAPGGPVRRWASANGLVFRPEPGRGFTLAGLWQRRHVRVECGDALRPYIEGQELSARAALDLQTEASVILMNRVLRRQLDHRVQVLRAEGVPDAAMPEEAQWLSTFHEAGWVGPSAEFWGRYAVLTDAPELAREWLQPEVIDRLMHWPLGGVRPDTPLLFMLLRGKVYLRLQMEPPPDPDTAVHALDLFHRLALRALVLQPGGGLDGLSSRA